MNNSMITSITCCKKCRNGFFKISILDDLCHLCRNDSTSDTTLEPSKIND